MQAESEAGAMVPIAAPKKEAMIWGVYPIAPWLPLARPFFVLRESLYRDGAYRQCDRPCCRSWPCTRRCPRGRCEPVGWFPAQQSALLTLIDLRSTWRVGLGRVAACPCRLS